jgi:hypothetical protein
MIIYRNFKGEEFKTEKEYEDNLKRLMNTKIIDFSEYHLNSFINEYFPERFRNSQMAVPFKSIKDNKTYYGISDDVITINVKNINRNNYGENYIVLEFVKTMRCDDKFIDYNNCCSSINLTTNYLLNGETLLRDFKKEVMNTLEKVCKNWLQHEIKDMSEMLNKFLIKEYHKNANRTE